MKRSQDWYNFGWQVGTTSGVDASPSASRSSPQSSPATSWYELGWRAGMEANLESTPPSQSFKGLATPLKHSWHAVVRFFSVAFCESLEPRIWISDKTKGLFNAYDPRSGRMLHGATEQEVRTWLEDRYSI